MNSKWASWNRICFYDKKKSPLNNLLLCLSHAKENIIIFETTQANNCLFERFKKKNLRLFYLKCCEGRYPLQLGKGIDPPTSKETPGSQGFSLGGVWGGALKRTIQHFNCWYGRRKKFFSLTSIYLAQVEKIHWQKTEENTDYWESNNNTTKLWHMEFVSFNWSRGATARTAYCISRTMVKFHRQL